MMVELKETLEQQQPTEVTAEATTKEPDQQYEICPCCNKPTLLKPIKMQDEMIDVFTAGLISGVPFRWLYPLYNGALKLNVTRLDTETTKVLHRGFNLLDSILEKDPHGLDSDIKALKNCLQIYICIIEIEITSADTTKIYYPSEAAIGLIDEITKFYKEMKDGISNTELANLISSYLAKITEANIVSAIDLTLLTSVCLTHARVYDLISEAGFDKNFWKGIDLA